MQGFGLSRDSIIKKLEKGENLIWEDLVEVFGGMDDRKVLVRAVNFLLINLKGESRDLLVNLINEDFKIWPHYSLDTEEINPICFDKWKCVCVNKETKRFLLNFVQADNQKSSTLNDLKNSILDI